MLLLVYKKVSRTFDACNTDKMALTGTMPQMREIPLWKLYHILRKGIGRKFQIKLEIYARIY